MIDSFEELIQETPITVEDGSSLDTTNFPFNDESWDSPNDTNNTNTTDMIDLFCIWFESNINANYILNSQFKFNDQIRNEITLIQKDEIQQGLLIC